MADGMIEEDFSPKDRENYKTPDGEFRMDFGQPFDRAAIWICRRCGAMVERQCANHAVLHKTVDELRGR